MSADILEKYVEDQFADAADDQVDVRVEQIDQAGASQNDFSQPQTDDLYEDEEEMDELLDDEDDEEYEDAEFDLNYGDQWFSAGGGMSK